jgi:hypothetical protein
MVQKGVAMLINEEDISSEEQETLNTGVSEFTL